MGSERGSAALGVTGAVVLATLVGVGVYAVIRDRRLATADTQLVAAPPASRPAPATEEPAPAPEPVASTPTPPQPVDGAEAAVGPTVATETPAPDSVSREELGEALRALRAPVTACANRAGFVGRFKVKFTVLPTGRVAVVTIDDVEPELAACVSRLFKARTFTPTTNGVTASVPFQIAGD